MIAAPDLSRRYIQSRNRREKILHSASRLFAEKGFHRTTTRQIAEAAGVSEGTLYNYFESKIELLFGIMEHLTDYHLPDSELANFLPGEVAQFIKQILEDRKTFGDHTAPMQQAILSEILADANLRKRYYQKVIKPYLKIMEKKLYGLIENQETRPFDVPSVARLITGLWLGWFILQILGDPQVENEWPSLAMNSAEILAMGILSRS